MPKHSSSTRKYINDDLDDLEEHYYQNQNMNLNRNIIASRQSKESDERMRNFNVDPSLLSANIIQPNANLASSSASSQKPLIVNKSDKVIDTTYLFVVFAIICQVCALITAAITFIFPFWINLTVTTGIHKPNEPINITNKLNSISLLGNQTTNDFKFYLGLWEVKMDRSLQIYDPTTPNLVYQNSYPQSKLWLNANINVPSEAFLIKFSQFINLTTANLFIVQILEILHLVFIFLAFCFTSFTLCLCNSRSYCWYLVCLVLTLISFLLGSAVIGLLVYWGGYTNDEVRLVDEKGATQNLDKAFNWCFWVSVGINSSLLLACFLILIYMFVSICMIYIRNHQKLSSKGIEKKRDMSFQNGFNDDIINERQSRIPRLQPNAIIPPVQRNDSRPSSAMAPNYQDRYSVQTQQLNHHMQQFPSQQNQNHSNSQYVFYTGHGNYHKQNVTIPEKEVPDYEPPSNFSQPNHLINYSMMIQQHTNANSNNSLVKNNNGRSSVPYSNETDQNVYNEFRFPSYR